MNLLDSPNFKTIQFDKYNYVYHTNISLSQISIESIEIYLNKRFMDWIKEKIIKFEPRTVFFCPPSLSIYMNYDHYDSSEEILEILHKSFTEELAPHICPSLKILIRKKMEYNNFMFDSIQGYVNKKYKVQDKDFTLIRKILTRVGL